jgi:hypothetical protein
MRAVQKADLTEGPDHSDISCVCKAQFPSSLYYQNLFQDDQIFMLAKFSPTSIFSTHALMTLSTKNTGQQDPILALTLQEQFVLYVNSPR